MSNEQQQNNNYEAQQEPKQKTYVPSLSFIIILILIGLFVIYCKTVLPNQLYEKAKKDYKEGRYEQANKIFNMFSSMNPFDENIIKYQVMTLAKMPNKYSSQKKLYEISQYDEDSDAEKFADFVVKQIAAQLEKEAGDNYIEEVLLDNMVVRWNLAYKPISFYIKDTVQSPSYFKEMVYDAFSEWQNSSGSFVSFKEASSEDSADILVMISNTVPNEAKEYYSKYQIGNTIPVFKNEKLQQMVINLIPTSPNNLTLSENEVANIMRHEVGHALGIWGHSSSQGDVMYYTGDNVTSSAIKKRLSTRDINTLKLLYRLYPDSINVALSSEESENLIYHYILTKNYKRNSELEIRRIMNELNANRQDITKWVDLAIEYSMNERYEQSNRILSMALPLIYRDDNNLHVIYYNIAANYYNMHEYKYAQRYCNMAGRIHNDFETRVLNAFIEYKLKNYAFAEKELSDLFRKKPSDIEIAVKLAAIYRKNKQNDKAKEVIATLIQHNKSAKNDRRVKKYNRGKLYFTALLGI